MASGRTWGKRILIALGVVVALVVVLIAAAFGYLVYLKVPQSASGITARQSAPAPSWPVATPTRSSTRTSSAPARS